MAIKKTKKDTREVRKVYTNEEAFKSSLEYFNGDELAARVWVNKYALKSSDGSIFEQNPNDMHRRIAKELHRIELKYENPMSEDELFAILKDFKYIVPQGGPMSGIGNNEQIVSLSNCFVIGTEGESDSYGAIMKVDQEQVQLMKRRGGVGHDLSHIRPKGSEVKNSALTSTGIVPFMERYSNSTREVAQDGRRGALMLSVSIKHPDAEDFVDAKIDGQKVTGANVSVKIDDNFMQSIKDGKKYTQQYPVESETPKVTKEIDPSNLWDKIVTNAWKSAEPGILFWDTVINESIADCYADLGYKTVSTNPCGEIPLCPYDSCRLLAINLYSYVENPFTPKAKFNFELFKKHSIIAQRIMDNIIDLEIEKVDGIIDKINSDPENMEVKRVERQLWENIKKKAQEGRRTGVGITGEGDMIASLGLTYGSENAIDFSVEVHKTLALAAYRSSVDMAKDRGAFSIYDTLREQNNPMIARIKEADPELYKDMSMYGRRNISLLTIAPTGTTSLMTQTTSGIEPVFLPVYKRRRKVNPNDKDVNVTFIDEVGDAWEEYNVYHHNFITWMETKGYKRSDVDTMDEAKLDELIKQSPYNGATSNDVDWVSKVKMQGAIQKWVDHSISVTVNLPSDVEKEVVGKVYQTAWESGCKGVTVYRDGSRSGVLISKDEKKQEKQISYKKRPPVVETEILRFKNGVDEWIAFVGMVDGNPYEIFTGMVDEDVLNVPKKINRGIIIKNKTTEGKSRYDFQYTDKHGYNTTFEGLNRLFNKEYWNYAKLISGVLRHGMPIVEIVALISKLQLDSDAINSWKAGVERALKKYIPNGTKEKVGVICPECDQTNTLVYQDGCLTCNSCGYSKCG